MRVCQSEKSHAGAPRKVDGERLRRGRQGRRGRRDWRLGRGPLGRRLRRAARREERCLHARIEHTVEGQQWAGWAKMARFRGVGRLHTFGDAEEVAPSRPMGPAWGGEPRRKDRTALNRSHRVRAAKAEGAARMATTQNRPIARWLLGRARSILGSSKASSRCPQSAPALSSRRTYCTGARRTDVEITVTREGIQKPAESMRVKAGISSEDFRS